MHGEVLSVSRLAPRMVRIVLGGSGLSDFVANEFADQYINILFPPKGASYTVPFDETHVRTLPSAERPIGRRYTIRQWDDEHQQLTIDFVVHGDVGTAGRWANNAKVGDLVQFSGPAGGFVVDPTADWYLMAGDESAIPAIASALECSPVGKSIEAVLIVDNADHELQLSSPGNLTITWVHRDQNPEGLVSAVEKLTFPDGDVQVFVHGEATEVRAVRKHLLAIRGVERDRSSISPYWRRDFTDEKWREVKREWALAVEADV